MPAKPAPTSDWERAETGRRAIDALLREHPDAVLYASSSDGKVVPIPESLELAGHPVLAAEGRSGIDLFVAEDRMAVVNAWMRVKEETVAGATVRLRSDPDQWMAGSMLDLRSTHGVILSMIWPTDEAPEDEDARLRASSASATPRFCARKQDEEGNVIEFDDAYLQMFGYTAEEVAGKPTFDRVHPDDQARVIEGWVGVVTTGRVQMFRVRVKRGDGSWLWVDTTLHNCMDDEHQPHVLAECIDVSAEMAAQEALQDREELLRHLIEEMPDGLLQLDAKRNVLFHNARLLEILHGSAGEAASGSAAPAVRTLPELLRTLTDEAKRSFDAVVERALKDGLRGDVEVEAALPFGGRQDILVKVRPLQRNTGVASGVIASVLDITDSARTRRELERRASFDALTGVHNRSSIMGALSAELEKSSDTGVVYVDLDHFKSINDTLGHAAGDEVLVHVTERLRSAMRSSDELGRLGGDEFVILLRGVSGLGVAMSAAQRISESVRGTWELSCGSFELCASVGVACADGTSISAEELVQRADTAMYRSKEKRRGVPVLAA